MKKGVLEGEKGGGERVRNHKCLVVSEMTKCLSFGVYEFRLEVGDFHAILASRFVNKFP